MISTELLRRYPQFGPFDADQLRALAIAGERVTVPPDAAIFEAGQRAEALYLLLGGTVELYDVVESQAQPGLRREVFLSEVTAGEMFGVSALCEGGYTLTARAGAPADLVRLDAAGLRALAQSDPRFDARLARLAVQALSQRLRDTRVLLAAARA
jgi:NTE family protein